MLHWHPHPDVWALIIVMSALYIVALRRWGPRFAPLGAEPATTKQKWFFFSGVFALWVGADWPVHEISEEYLFSVHMLQHTVFSLVAPPLLLLGLPPWLLRVVLRPPKLFAVVRFLTRPLVALLAFNAVIAITHWPFLVNASVTNELLHLSIHTVLVTTALMMWWPVVDPLPELTRLTPPGKMLYLFLQSIVPTVPASFLTFAETPIYDFYTRVPRLIDLSPLADQQIAGLIMKVGGGLLLWLVIATLFFKWYAREERQEVAEVTWDDFEHDLRAWELRR
ncbi:MAG TPA: cytochrome c oxidase assembly protein [Actinomycetota bacterium]|nr:cytochrome c oxidase assembly protein [Actinomycetota bacterium]